MKRCTINRTANCTRTPGLIWAHLGIDLGRPRDCAVLMAPAHRPHGRPTKSRPGNRQCDHNVLVLLSPAASSSNSRRRASQTSRVNLNWFRDGPHCDEPTDALAGQHWRCAQAHNTTRPNRQPLLHPRDAPQGRLQRSAEVPRVERTARDRDLAIAADVEDRRCRLSAAGHTIIETDVADLGHLIDFNHQESP